MGTSAPPATGYADDQRIENWDSPSLYSDSAVNVPVSVQTGTMDVSRYAYLAGRDLTQNADLLVTMTWTMFQGGAGLVGVRNFPLTASSLAVAQYRLPNLGPWVNVQWTKIGAGVAVHTSQLIGTNRFHPLEFIPQAPVLVDRKAVVVAANGTDIVYPVDYYAGPLDIWTFSGTPGFILHIDHLNSGGVWDFAWEAAPGVANVDQQFRVVVPPGAWRMRIDNTSAGAATYYLSVRQSQTGST